MANTYEDQEIVLNGDTHVMAPWLGIIGLGSSYVNKANQDNNFENAQQCRKLMYKRMWQLGWRGVKGFVAGGRVKKV